MAEAVVFENIRDREYYQRLNEILDEVFQVAAGREWDWPEMAQRAGLNHNTIYRLGNRLTKWPRFATVYKLARAVGGQLELRVQRAKGKVKQG